MLILTHKILKLTCSLHCFYWIDFKIKFAEMMTNLILVFSSPDLFYKFIMMIGIYIWMIFYFSHQFCLSTKPWIAKKHIPELIYLNDLNGCDIIVKKPSLIQRLTIRGLLMSQIGSILRFSQIHPLRPSHNDQSERSLPTSCLK